MAKSQISSSSRNFVGGSIFYLEYILLLAICCFINVHLGLSCSPKVMDEECQTGYDSLVILKDRFEASMVLSAVGDAMGYKKGKWEFNLNGSAIHEELKQMGGLDNLKISHPKWILSDDTVMHLATAKGIVQYFEHSGPSKRKSLYLSIAEEYKECMKDMDGRAPGPTCIKGASKLNINREDGYQIPFDKRGGGCGAAMRSMCIGLFYSTRKEEDLEKLIAVSIESGRMTHNNPTGYLGSLASALFTRYAIQKVPVHEWGFQLMKLLPKAKEYVKSQNRDVEKNLETWNYFEEQWSNYLKLRGIADGTSKPKFPDKYDVKERDEYYKEISFDGWGGASGHDAPMIAYDALLGSGKDWKELCLRGVLHGGDNDSTGAIAGAWFGALYGYEGVPKGHYEDLEYLDKIQQIAAKLFELHNIAHQEEL